MKRELILARLKAGEPAGAGLLFPDRGAQSRFWSRVNASNDYRAAVAEIRAEGRRLLEEPIAEPTYSQFAMFERTGNRLKFEGAYFAKRRRLNTMALLSLLEPDDERYRAALHNAIWVICNEYTWCLPAHLRDSAETDGGQAFAVDSPEWSRRERHTQIDLFAAETGFALSEILVLTADELPPLLRSRIVEEVVGRLFKPYLQHGPYHWETADHNWAAVCAGSIGSAALLLLDDPEQLATMIGKAMGTMDHYLSGFGYDGACLEGVGYWNYGFGYYVYFADLLKRRTRGEVNLLGDEKVRQIARFQQQAYLDGGMTVNFSDSPQLAYVQIGLSHYLADLYPEVAAPPDQLRAPFTEDHCSRWAHAFRNLLWFDPERKGERWADGDFHLPDAQWLISRLTTTDGRFGFAAKGGHNNEPHNHNDIGQFMLTGDGEVFVCDLGSGEYTADYFGAARYAYACNGSQGHSVPVIDGRNQAEGAESTARDMRVTLGEQRVGLQLDLAAAYRLPRLDALLRRFEWHKSELPLLEMEDTYRFNAAPLSITERIVTRIKPRVHDNSTVTLQGQSGRRLVIHYDASALEPSVEAQTMRDHDGRDSAWYAIDFKVREPKLEQQVRLTFQFE